VRALLLDFNGTLSDDEPLLCRARSRATYCAAVTTTLPAERLSGADELAERVDRDLISRLVSSA
jgi:beta-phosphoglucomutase-like phosphatase (HAD superfamily)